MRKFQLTVTTQDPRLGDERVVFEERGLIWDVALRLANKYSRQGYWSSIYNAGGECVEEMHSQQALEAA